VDELREAGVCLISATQTPLSFYASFETERKADVFMANLRTQIHFRAADEKGAKIISDKLGAREIRKYSGGISGGKRSSNWQVTMEPWFKPAELQSLGPGRATLSHPRSNGRPRICRLSYTSFTMNGAH
jgi:type IV secretory pathway TraG/TraD family ATPase VirD4